MRNLKDDLKKVSENQNEESVEIKLLSFKKLINEYKKTSLKNYNRIKILLYYYPSIFEDSTIEEIELTMKYPDKVYMTIENGDYRYKVLDDIFVKKYNGNLELFVRGRYIKVIDLFQYFNV